MVAAVVGRNREAGSTRAAPTSAAWSRRGSRTGCRAAAAGASATGRTGTTAGDDPARGAVAGTCAAVALTDRSHDPRCAACVRYRVADSDSDFDSSGEPARYRFRQYGASQWDARRRVVAAAHDSCVGFDFADHGELRDRVVLTAARPPRRRGPGSNAAGPSSSFCGSDQGSRPYGSTGRASFIEASAYPRQ